MWLSLLSGILGLIVALGFGRFAYTPMVPVMMGQTFLSVDYAGFVASVNYLGYILGALTPLFWKGPGVRTITLRWGIVLTVIGLLMMSVDYSDDKKITMWSIARFLNGVGSGWMLVNISSIVLQHLANFQRLSLVGWLYSGVGIGSLIVTCAVMFFERQQMLWYIDWFYLGLLSIFFSIPVWIFLKDDFVLKKDVLQENVVKQNGLAKKNSIQTEVNILQSKHAAQKTLHEHVSFSSINIPAVWYLAFSYVCKGFSYIIVMTFLPVMSAGLGFWAESSWLILLCTAIPSAVIWGWLSEHYGNIRCLQMAFLLEAVGIIFPVLFKNDLGVIVCALLVGSTFMGIVTMITAQAQRIKPHASTMIIALITGVYGVGQMIGPSFAGVIAQRTGSFSYALLFAALLMFIGYFLLAKLRSEKQKLLAV